jgi:hypothetical protein
MVECELLYSYYSCSVDGTPPNVSTIYSRKKVIEKFFAKGEDLYFHFSIIHPNANAKSVRISWIPIFRPKI